MKIYIRIDSDRNITFVSLDKADGAYVFETDITDLFSIVSKYKISNDYTINPSTNTITGTLELKPVTIAVYPSTLELKIGESNSNIVVQVENGVTDISTAQIGDSTVARIAYDTTLRQYTVTGLKEGTTNIIFTASADINKTANLVLIIKPVD